jgi:hypothetical protein
VSRPATSAAITDVLLRARAAYDACVRLNARHRDRRGGRAGPAECSREDEARAYREAVDAVAELGRQMARLQMIEEGICGAS